VTCCQYISGAGTDLVAFDVGSKATLRGETNSFFLKVAHDFSGFVETAGNLFGVLEFGEFRANQSENNGLVLGKSSKRLKVTSARGIVYN